MKRRDFLAASCAAGLASAGTSAAADGSGKRSSQDKEYYELRLYRLESEVKKKALCEFFCSAAVPALNRIGICPVGVFGALEPEEDNHDVYVLLPHKSLASVVTATHCLLADKEFLKAGAEFLDAPKSNPAYERVESSLLLAFDEIPKLECPTEKESRIFQLRIYESHSAKKGQRKIEMFNAGGEIALFRRVGLNPVFFGETLVGSKVPNLTYMVGFDDMETSKASWKKFLADPAWEKLKADPRYADTVSNITNLLLRPLACSQI